LARAGGTITFPASFMLVAAANPCPCGNLGHPTRPCVCGEAARLRYRARLSGPLLDRIDLRVELSPVSPAVLLNARPAEDSATVRGRVERARRRQLERYGGAVASNAALSAEQVTEAANPTTRALAALQQHMEVSGLSARVGRRLLKVARTLADLDSVEQSGGRADRVQEDHIHRAVGLRLEDADLPESR
jgi:magnesium chelatase family protein